MSYCDQHVFVTKINYSKADFLVFISVVVIVVAVLHLG